MGMTTKLRTDHDSLGPVTLPANALYGPQTARAMTNFAISGRTAHPPLLKAYLRLKAACARANAKCGALPESIAKSIEAACEQLLDQMRDTPQGDWQTHFPVDPYQAGAGTSQNMNINEVVANLANQALGQPLGSASPVHPNDHVNRSQSTNDTYPTAMRLALLEASTPLLLELNALGESFGLKGQQWHSIAKAARTHLQDAVPMRLGQEFRAYAKTLHRCARWVESARDELRELGLGGSAAGTGLTVPDGFQAFAIEELSRLTEEPLRPADDLCEAMQSQSPVMFYSSMLRTSALELTRICNDLRLLASGPSTGLAEIILPAVQPGSSIMPGKVNPSILEMANQACYSVLGYDHSVAMAMQAGQLELNVMMPIMAYSLLEASAVLTHAVRTLRERCVEGLEANESRLRRYFEGTPQIATALSPRLGYEKTAHLVQESLRSGRSVVELVRERKLVPEDELASLLDVGRLTGR